MRCPAVIVGLSYPLLPTLPENKKEKREGRRTKEKTKEKKVHSLGVLVLFALHLHWVLHHLFPSQRRQRNHPTDPGFLQEDSTAGVASSFSKGVIIRDLGCFLAQVLPTLFHNPLVWRAQASRLSG